MSGDATSENALRREKGYYQISHLYNKIIKWNLPPNVGADGNQVYIFLPRTLALNIERQIWLYDSGCQFGFDNKLFSRRWAKMSFAVVMLHFVCVCVVQSLVLYCLIGRVPSRTSSSWRCPSFCICVDRGCLGSRGLSGCSFAQAGLTCQAVRFMHGTVIFWLPCGDFIVNWITWGFHGCESLGTKDYVIYGLALGESPITCAKSKWCVS
jgi:hypothetical protein